MYLARLVKQASVCCLGTEVLLIAWLNRQGMIYVAMDSGYILNDQVIANVFFQYTGLYAENICIEST